MTERPAEVREQARRGNGDVAPNDLARTLETFPRDADLVGETLSELDPEQRSAAVATVAERLADEDPAVRRGAAVALRVCFETAPDADSAVANDLARVLADDDHVVRKQAGTALRNLARQDPETGREAVDHLPELFDPGSPDLLAVGLDAAAAIAEGESDAVVPLLGPLLDTLEALADREPERTEVRGAGPELPPAARERDRQSAIERDRQRRRIVSIVGATLAARPETASSVRPALSDVLRNEEVGRDRAVLAEALGRAAESDPAAVAPLVDDFAVLLDDSESGVVGSAARALGLLADTHGRRVADATETHVGALADLLNGEGTSVRVASAALLAYVAEHRPATVEPVADSLIAALDDANPDVRASAAFALGVGGIRRSLSDLRDVAETDPDERVRTTASTAIDRLESE